MGTASVATITKAPHTVNSIFGNAVNAVWIDEFDATQTSAYPRNDKLKFKGDPLALVLAYRENGMENWKITEHLTSSSTWDLLATKEHVQQANDIKKYYRNKFVINIFKHGDRGMSKFRQDLRDYVESDNPYTVYKNDIPMIVKLPEFYEEDKMMDEFVKEYRMDAKHYENVTDSRFLYPMRKHHRKTKRTDQLHFWFQDSNKLVYRINIDPKNPLLHLFEREFAKDKICLSGTFYSTRIRGQDYTFYSLNNWKFA
jgi:hypothetical protein